MATIVRIQGRDARLTPQGWETGDATLDRICADAATLGGRGYDPNPSQAAADALANALGGEVISVDALAEDALPAGAIY